MLFNSHAFLFFFLPLALAGYYAIPVRRRSAWLVAASYFFYGWWDWRYCGLLLLGASTKTPAASPVRPHTPVPRWEAWKTRTRTLRAPLEKASQSSLDATSSLFANDTA